MRSTPRRAEAERVVLPVGAIADADQRADHLRDVVKADGWVGDARLAEAERLAEALTEPVPRSVFQPQPEPSAPAHWTPQAGEEAASERAAALAGNPHEIAAAVRRMILAGCARSRSARR